MSCTSCGQNPEPGDRFCRDCGQRLPNDTPAAAAGEVERAAELVRQASDRLAAGSAAEAQALAIRALQHDSHCREARLLLAGLAEESGDTTQALEQMDSVLAAGPDAALEVRRYELARQLRPARRIRPRAAIAAGAAVPLLLVTGMMQFAGGRGSRSAAPAQPPAVLPLLPQQAAPSDAAAQAAPLIPPVQGNAPGAAVAAGPTFPDAPRLPALPRSAGAAVTARAGLPVVIDTPPQPKKPLQAAEVGEVAPLQPPAGAVIPGSASSPAGSGAPAPQKPVELLKPAIGFIKIEPLAREGEREQQDGSQPAAAAAAQAEAASFLRQAWNEMQQADQLYSRRLLDQSASRYERALGLLRAARERAGARGDGAIGRTEAICRQALALVQSARREAAIRPY